MFDITIAITITVFRQIEDILDQLQKYGRRAGVEDVKKCREGAVDR